jgi:hypothetical protein
MMKWLSFLLVLGVAAWAAWHFGVVQAAAGAFDDWLAYIGMGRGSEQMGTSREWKGGYWDRSK